ncbi:MAG TPA: T9SS type A sorting domain-containing protein [Chitinophagales bacterium]|nr:T9SS type A sorting domain-containing protein [Chitinophagales bacterium]
MKKQILCLLLLLFYCIRLLAQNAPSIEWQKPLGGSIGEEAFSIQQTANGEFIIAGWSSSDNGDVTGNHGLTDYWIVKLDSSGNTIWQRCLGGSDNDDGKSIQQTTDGGFIIAGYSQSNNGDVSGNHGSGDYWVVKLDSSGDIEWQKSFGGSDIEAANSIQQTLDGGLIVAGFSESNDGDVSGNHGYKDYWIVKLNSDTNIHWQKSLGGSSDDYPYSIRQTIDSGFIIAGYSRSNDEDVTGNHGLRDFWIVKLDSLGNMQWQKSLGGSDNEAAYSIQQTTEGGFIVAGSSASNDGDVSFNHGSSDCWIVKLDSSGSIEWQKSLGGSYTDEAYSIQQTSDSGFVVAGWSGSSDGDASLNHGLGDFWVVKLDTSGSIQWEKSMGGTDYEWAYSIDQTADAGYIVAGFSGSNNGDVSSNHGNYDYWVVKLSPEIPLGLPAVSNEKIFSVYPNPNNGNVTITATFTSPQSLVIKLTDIVGREVLSFDEGLVSGNFTAQYDLSTLSSGTYFLKMIHDETSEVKKIEIEK